MSFLSRGGGALDYFPFRYEGSRLVFRGPGRQLDEPFVAVLGGTETFGRFVERPYPALVEAATALRMVNLGYPGAGLDAFLNDPGALRVAVKADAVVLQVLGAHTLSNRFYMVHPRRNDRFLSVSDAFRARFPDVDATEFHFTRHLLMALREHSPAAYAEVLGELRVAWVARMRRLMEALSPRPVVALWIGCRRPYDWQDDPVRDPALVTQAMAEDAFVGAAAFVTVATEPAPGAAALVGKSYHPGEEQAASLMPGPPVHEEIAARLGPVLLKLTG